MKTQKYIDQVNIAGITQYNSVVNIASSLTLNQFVNFTGVAGIVGVGVGSPIY